MIDSESIFDDVGHKLMAQLHRSRILPSLRGRYISLHPGRGTHDRGIRFHCMFPCWMYGQLGWMVSGGICGSGLCRDRRHVSRNGKSLCSQESLQKLIRQFIFLFIGALLPFDYWHADNNIVDGWRLFVLGVVVLILRRLPFVIPMVNCNERKRCCS